ncbi:MAG TPA: hypothetical protein VLR50_07695 [Desulfobacterales bacterium]|nr:hypothetical protein [Desulfobacterales bacterium]
MYGFKDDTVGAGSQKSRGSLGQRNSPPNGDFRLFAPEKAKQNAHTFPAHQPGRFVALDGHMGHPGGKKIFQESPVTAYRHSFTWPGAHGVGKFLHGNVSGRTVNPQPSTRRGAGRGIEKNVQIHLAGAGMLRDDALGSSVMDEAIAGIAGVLRGE